MTSKFHPVLRGFLRIQALARTTKTSRIQKIPSRTCNPFRWYCQYQPLMPVKMASRKIKINQWSDGE